MTDFAVTNFTGPPKNGNYLPGDTLTDSAGTKWVCVAGGSPGTWAIASLYGGAKFSTDV